MDDQFDPLQKVELAMLRAEHQKRFQVMINYVKEKVGVGIEYSNPVVHVVVSETGAYYELHDLPEEFCGAVGEDVQRHFVTPDEAIDLLKAAVHATERVTPENTRQCQILVLYSRRGLVDRKNCYVYDYSPGERQSTPLRIGAFQPDAMPLFFKVKLDADFGVEVTGHQRSIVFCMANAGDRHLLIRILFEGSQMTDLGSLATSKTVH